MATEADGAAGGGPARPELQEIAVTIADTAIPFRVAVDGEGPAFFSLGVRKSGSTMLHRIVGFLARVAGVNVVDMPATVFRNGFTYAQLLEQDLSPLIRPGNAYIGFRAAPLPLETMDLYRTAPKLFMFRDPRDALVSQYFSDAYSHSLPQATGASGEGREQFLRKREEAQGMPIDDWVLDKAGAMRRTMLQYRPVLADPMTLQLRYEDYVFQKRRLIAKLCRHFGWRVWPGHVDRILAEVDQVPDTEEPTRFVRRVIPGDHRAKLQPETIQRLDRILSEVLELYDYY